MVICTVVVDVEVTNFSPLANVAFGSTVAQLIDHCLMNWNV